MNTNSNSDIIHLTLVTYGMIVVMLIIIALISIGDAQVTSQLDGPGIASNNLEYLRTLERRYEHGHDCYDIEADPAHQYEYWLHRVYCD